MTNQEVFDKVARHLLTQGKRAVSASQPGKCQYRGADGLKCAVGCLIQDEYYSADFEGAAAPSMTERGLSGTDERQRDLLIASLEASGIVPDNWPILVRLQMVHDERSPKDWRFGLQIAAEAFSLSPAVLSEFPAP